MTQQFHSWVYIQKRPKTLIQKDTFILMFIADLFTIAKYGSKIGSRIYCIAWGIQPIFFSNRKWKVTFKNYILKKKENEATKARNIK